MAAYVHTLPERIGAEENRATAVPEPPQQLIAVVVLSFVVFVGLGVTVAQYVSSGYKGASNPDPETVAKAIQPDDEVVFLKLIGEVPSGLPLPVMPL